MDKKFWESKKWWAAVVAVIIPIANKMFGLNMDDAEIWAAILPIMSYIIGQGFADAGR